MRLLILLLPLPVLEEEEDDCNPAAILIFLSTPPFDRAGSLLLALLEIICAMLKKLRKGSFRVALGKPRVALMLGFDEAVLGL